MRRLSGMVLAVLALASAFVFGVVLYQTLSGDFVGGEVAFVWAITGVVGVVTLGLWAGTFAVLSREEQQSRVLWLLGVGIAVALLVGVGVGFITDNTDELLLEVTMVTDEDSIACSYSGLTDEITVGEVDIVFHNQAMTGGTGWMDLVRFNEDKTIQNIDEYLASDETGAPTWATRVYLADFVPTRPAQIR